MYSTIQIATVQWLIWYWVAVEAIVVGLVYNLYMCF